MAFVSRGCVCPAWCCYGGFAAGALWGWLCRLGLGWVHGRVDRLRIRRISLLFFPLQTIAPSLRGLPAPAGWGSHNPRAVFLYAPVLAIIWGDFGILECPHGPFRRNAARTFPVCTSAGNHLGRFWNIGISARTFQENVPVHSVLKWQPYFVQYALLHENSPGSWPELYFSIRKPYLALRS